MLENDCSLITLHHYCALFVVVCMCNFRSLTFLHRLSINRSYNAMFAPLQDARGYVVGASHSYLDVDRDNDQLYDETAFMASNVSQPMFHDQPAVTPLRRQSESFADHHMLNSVNVGDFYLNQVL